jgi:dCMP deaminase
MNKELLKQIKEISHYPYDRISWDEKWLGHAYLASLRSPDARTKCGTVFVKDNQIVSEGYNGFIRGIRDDILPNYHGSTDPLLNKYDYFIHSEANCIVNAARIGKSTEGCSAYITSYPCINCYQLMWQAGVVSIYIPKGCVNAVCVSNEKAKKQMELLHILTENKLPIVELECTIPILDFSKTKV